VLPCTHGVIDTLLTFLPECPESFAHHVLRERACRAAWSTIQPGQYNKVGETNSLLESTAWMAESRSMFNRDFTT
jgi:hypothetical protein